MILPEFNLLSTVAVSQFKIIFKNLSQHASIILTRDKCYSRKIIVFFPKLERLLQLEHLTSDKQRLWFFYIVLKYCLISCNIDNLLAYMSSLMRRHISFWFPCKSLVKSNSQRSHFYLLFERKWVMSICYNGLCRKNSLYRKSMTIILILHGKRGINKRKFCKPKFFSNTTFIYGKGLTIS